MNRSAMGLEDIIMILLIFFLSASAVNNKNSKDDNRKARGRIEISISGSNSLVTECELDGKACNLKSKNLNVDELNDVLKELCTPSVDLIIAFNHDTLHVKARGIINKISQNSCGFYEK